MTNEEKVEKYKKEIDAVFRIDKALDILNTRDELVKLGDRSNLDSFDMTTIGRHSKTHFVKIEVHDVCPLNTFLVRWMLSKLKIAGITVEEISHDQIKNYSTEELKTKLRDDFNLIIEKL